MACVVLCVQTESCHYFKDRIKWGLKDSWSGSDICVLKSQCFIWEAAFQFIIMHILLTQPVKTVIWTLRGPAWTHYTTCLGPSRLWLGTRRRWKSIGKLGNVFNKRKNLSQLWLNADTSHFHRQLFTHHMGYGTNRCKWKIFLNFLCSVSVSSRIMDQLARKYTAKNVSSATVYYFTLIW